MIAETSLFPADNSAAPSPPSPPPAPPPDPATRIAMLETTLRCVHAQLGRIITDAQIEQRVIAITLGLPAEPVRKATAADVRRLQSIIDGMAERIAKAEKGSAT